ncbi:hypothetical protein ACOMHN_052176 [Nucella lapillus]
MKAVEKRKEEEDSPGRRHCNQTVRAEGIATRQSGQKALQNGTRAKLQVGCGRPRDIGPSGPTLNDATGRGWLIPPITIGTGWRLIDIYGGRGTHKGSPTAAVIPGFKGTGTGTRLAKVGLKCRLSVKFSWGQFIASFSPFCRLQVAGLFMSPPHVRSLVSDLVWPV